MFSSEKPWSLEHVVEMTAAYCAAKACYKFGSEVVSIGVPLQCGGHGNGLGRGVGVVLVLGVGVPVAVAVSVGLGVVPTGTKVHPPLAGPPTPLQKY